MFTGIPVVSTMPRGKIGQRNAAREDYYDIPKTVKLSQSLLDALNRRKDATGVPIGTQIRMATIRALESENPPVEDHAICVDMGDAERAALLKIAQRLLLPDEAYFLEVLARRAVEVDVQQTANYLLGDLTEKPQSAQPNPQPQPQPAQPPATHAERFAAEMRRDIRHAVQKQLPAMDAEEKAEAKAAMARDAKKPNDRPKRGRKAA